MKAGETVNDYFARTLTIANKMKANGEHKSETKIVEKVLRSMTSKFNYVVCSIEEAQDTTDLSIDELQSSLLVHEQKMLNPEEEQAIKVTYGDSSTRGRGHGRYRGRGRRRGRTTFDKSTIECYKCHKLGNFQWECHSQENNYTESSDEMFLMARVGDESLKSDEWFLDSGCSNHICNKKDYFADLNEEFVDNVKLGNNASLAVKGKGNVRLQIYNNIHVITEVFYVPKLKNNLLSLGQLQEKGLVVLIQHNHCKVHHSEKGVIIQYVMSSNRIFKIATVSLQSAPTCFNTATKDIGHLWHCRYGHLSFNGLNTLKQKEIVFELPRLIQPLKVCTECLNGKQKRDPFPKKSSWRAELPLKLVHSDLCGPIQPISNSNKRVFGCVAHVHVGATHRTKLDTRSLACVLLGVSEESKAYRLYDPISKRIIISRDVVFEEDCGWNWGEEFNNSIQSELDWNHDTESNVEVDDHEEIHEAADEEGLVQQDGAVQQEETSEHLLPRRQHTQPS
ncbi:hypothetical protein GQ457_12G010900 [Hibiscus cannabinus]